MVSEDNVRAVAKAFADALDRNDFDQAASMLAASCRYDRTKASPTTEGTLVGSDAIVESYRRQDARARRLFDRVEYSSVVEAVDGMTAVIRFTDVLEKAAQRHSYSCRQRIAINDVTLIELITQQEDIPAEAVAVRAFMERVGFALRSINFRVEVRTLTGASEASGSQHVREPEATGQARSSRATLTEQVPATRRRFSESTSSFHSVNGRTDCERSSSKPRRSSRSAFVRD